MRDRREVARRFLAVARNEIPDEWWFEPNDIEFVNGLGEEQHILRLIRGVVAYGGISALQLDDNPKVRARMLAFAGVDSADTEVSDRSLSDGANHATTVAGS